MKKPFQRMGFLIGMPEPAGADRHIDFGGNIGKALGIQDSWHTSKLILRVVEVGQAALLCQRTGTEIIKNNCAGLISVDEFKIAGKIIVLFFAVFSLPAGVIKPYVENLPVLREQLRQLIAEVIVVFRCA